MLRHPVSRPQPVFREMWAGDNDHPHSLYYIPTRSAQCDLQRVPSCSGRLWCCEACNYDACEACLTARVSELMSAPVPVKYGISTPTAPITTLGPLVSSQLRLFDALGADVSMCSPLSLQYALYMTLAAATPLSSTFEELQSSFDPIVDPAAVLRAFHAVSAGRASGVVLEIANAIFTRAKGDDSGAMDEVRPEFVHRLQSELFADVFPLVDGAGINTWAGAKTQGRVRALMPPGPVDGHTVVVNATYFKGSWVKVFDASKSRPDTFTSLLRGLQPCTMMHQRFDAADGVRAGVIDAQGTTAVRLPYAGGMFEAWFVLPGAPSTPLSTLDTARLWPNIAALPNACVQFACPRFSVDSGTVDCIPALKRLGIEAPFIPQAGLLGGFLDYRAFVNGVLHRAVCEVTEEGTVAAAATAVTFSNECCALQSSCFQMRLDRPFLFAVVHACSSSPVFIGRIEGL